MLSTFNRTELPHDLQIYIDYQSQIIRKKYFLLKKNAIAERRHILILNVGHLNSDSLA